MKIGIILWANTLADEVYLAKKAEAAGFHSAFTVEFFNRNGFVRAAAVASATDRIQIGTGIANAFVRSPLMHASAAMDLDELSQGRFILGIGSATRRMNQDWYGVPFEAPANRMKELVILLREAFAAQQGLGFRFEGKYWKLHVPMYSRPHAARKQIPLWIAGVNRGMLSAAGQVADALVGHPIASRRWHREVTLPTLREAESKAGRADGACALVPYVLTAIHEDRDQAIRDVKNQIGFYFTTSLYHSVLEHHGLQAVGKACRAALANFDINAMADAVPDSLVDEIAIACTPDEAQDRLAQWKDLCESPLIYAPSIGIPEERVRGHLENAIELFGKPSK